MRSSKKNEQSKPKSTANTTKGIMPSSNTNTKMNSTSVFTDPIEHIRELETKIKQLEKDNAESRIKIEQLKKLFEETDMARVAALKKQSLYETTARTKTFEVNKDIAEYLRELGEMTSDFYKTAAYRRAADIVATLDHEVESGESLLNINGIGKNIAARIDEFLDEYNDDEYVPESDTESVASTDGQIIIDDSDTDDDDDNYFVSYNSELTDVFDKLASFEEDPHKRNAYRNAADAIYNLPFKIVSGDQVSKGPRKVLGIGKGIAKKIDEFLETGKIEKLEKYEFPNLKLADALDSLCYYETDEYKKDAYDEAAYAISKLTFKVTSGDQVSKGPKKIPGIGKGIAKKIDEFLQTGKIKKLEELKRGGISTNEEIANALEQLAVLESGSNGSQNAFKIKAYKNAAKNIRKLDFEVTCGSELSKGPKKIPGIGKGIADKIDEFIVTGKIYRVDELSN